MTNDELDQLIECFHMEEKTERTRDELRAMVDKGMTCLNLAYCMADVILWLLYDVDAELAPFGASLEHRDKQMFKRLRDVLKTANRQAAEITRDVHLNADKDGYQGECDWWYNIIRLIEDRTGNNELKTKQVLQWLLTMPSQLNMFTVKSHFFKRLIDDDTIPR